MKHLAAYGTLRPGLDINKFHIKGYKLVYPGHMYYPAIIKSDPKNKVVVEVIDVDEESIEGYDSYEGVIHGLYEREKIKVYNGKDFFVDAWIYVAGNTLIKVKEKFIDVANQNWLSEEAVEERLVG